MLIKIQNRTQVLKIFKLESSNTSVINKLYESPNQNYTRNKEYEKEKINNFKKANVDNKYSISPTIHIKKDNNNSEIGEFKLELKSIEISILLIF